jgi:hypothetical protein
VFGTFPHQSDAVGGFSRLDTHLKSFLSQLSPHPTSKVPLQSKGPLGSHSVALNSHTPKSYTMPLLSLTREPSPQQVSLYLQQIYLSRT